MVLNDLYSILMVIFRHSAPVAKEIGIFQNLLTKVKSLKLSEKKWSYGTGVRTHYSGFIFWFI